VTSSEDDRPAALGWILEEIILMNNAFARLMLGFAAVILVALTGTTALADGIVFVGPNHDIKIVPPLEVLGLEQHGNSDF